MYVALAGNSGSGKTTLLPYLAAALEARAVGEPSAGSQFLRDSYSQPDRSAFAAQTEFLVKRAILLASAFRTSPRAIVSDRSIPEDLGVFVAAWRESAAITLEESNLLHKLGELVSLSIPPPAAYVYLYADLEVLVRRASSRRSELAIPRDTLERRQRMYGPWLNSVRLSGTPVLSWDTGRRPKQGMDGFAHEIASTIQKL